MMSRYSLSICTNVERGVQLINTIQHGIVNWLSGMYYSTIVSTSAITSELLSEVTAVFTGLLDGFTDVQFSW